LIIPLIITVSIYGYIKYGDNYGIGMGIFGIFMHQALRIYSRQQRSVIKHRDQKDMIDYARRARRFKATPSLSTIPIGTNLLLSGILVTVNGVVLDLGFPAWLTRRLPKENERNSKERISRKAESMMRLRPPRLKKLGDSWWLNRPKDKLRKAISWRSSSVRWRTGEGYKGWKITIRCLETCRVMIKIQPRSLFQELT